MATGGRAGYYGGGVSNGGRRSIRDWSWFGFLDGKKHATCSKGKLQLQQD